MLLVECRNLKKSYGDRLILDIENLCIYDQDRIGIVGSKWGRKNNSIESFKPKNRT